MLKKYKRLFKEQNIIDGIPEKEFKNKKFNITAIRNGKKTIFNKKPLNYDDAMEMLKNLKNAKIPSINQNSITYEIIK